MEPGGIVLLMSDGLDTLSATKYADVVTAARDRGVSFYVIHFQLFHARRREPGARRSSKGFRELAETNRRALLQIGRRKISARSHARYDLAPVFAAIDNDLRGQYVLGFYFSRDVARWPGASPVTIALANRKQQTAHPSDETTYRLASET